LSGNFFFFKEENLNFPFPSRGLKKLESKDSYFDLNFWAGMSLANGCKNGFTAQFDILPPPIVRRFLQPLNIYVYLYKLNIVFLQ
jgi:hypothetical protein